jgi:hypothetical protein
MAMVRAMDSLEEENKLVVMLNHHSKTNCERQRDYLAAYKKKQTPISQS